MKHICQGGILLLFFILSSCEKFEYNPYQERNNVIQDHLNQKNLDRLEAKAESSDDTITIVFSGDCQRFYHNLHELVDVTNSLSRVDFFIMAGDITDFGTLQEYEWINREMDRMAVPHFFAIGNHDFTGNGLTIFREIYGSENYSFRYKGYKFIFHDSNSREHNFDGTVPDLSWLQSELNDPSVSNSVCIGHVPPYDVDFDRNLERGYADILANAAGCRLSLHGHLHDTDDSFHYADGVRYIGSNGVGKEHALLLKLIDGKVFKTTIDY